MRGSLFSDAGSSHSKCCEGFSNMKCGRVPGTMLLSSSLSPDEHMVLPVRCWGSPTESLFLSVLRSSQKESRTFPSGYRS